MRTVTLDVPTPAAAPGASWQARALLEAPTADGPWTPIAAQGIATTVAPDGSIRDDPSSLQGPFTSNHATLNPGWYRMQWHDDQRTSAFSDPVQIGDVPLSTGRGGFTYGGRR
jgi:hypothetical protein